jgi:hypothetical protein
MKDELVANIVLQVVCCIERARIESGVARNIDHDLINASTYRYTRLKAPDIAMRYRIPYNRIMFALRKSNEIDEMKVYELSEAFWSELAHPLLLVKEILET